MPTITGFTPGTASPGDLVIITGSGFTGATAVKFGGIDALLFIVVSNTQINAYVPIGGNGIVSVTTGSGTGTLAGFVLIITKVRMIDSPPLGRAIVDEDLFWVWDSIRAILTYATGAELPSGSGGGGGGGAGNLGTALGSPFKVRNTDDNYSFDGTDSIITDTRLIDKSDYSVFSTDFNAEFENWEDPSGALTATAAGSTGAPDADYNGEAAVVGTGSGSGSTWRVNITSGVVVSVQQISGGSGYTIGDTFTIADLPGITFTVSALVDVLGNLVYDETNGILTIKNYQLSDKKHITIYADGVVSAGVQAFIASQQATITSHTRALGPILATIASQSKSGVIWPWRFAQSLIPSGWQECTDFQGKTCIGQDPSDLYNAVTNPTGLSQGINTIVGNKNVVLDANNIPELKTDASEFATGPGRTVQAYIEINAAASGKTFLTVNGSTSNDPVELLNPARIVMWIEFIG